MSSFDSSAFAVEAFSTDAFDLEEVAGSIRGTASGSCTVTGILTYEGEAVVAVASTSPGKPKRNRVFIERDGQILVFNSPAEASIYVTAEKEQSQTTYKPKRAIKKVRAVPKPQVVDTNALRAFYERIDERPVVRQIDEAIQLHDIETLIEMYEKLLIWQEEEDLITLLLAA